MFEMLKLKFPKLNDVQIQNILLELEYAFQIVEEPITS